MNNIKYFQISLNLDLIKEPGWLEEFRRKYDQPYHYHITLKTTTNLKKGNMESLKEKLSQVVKRYKVIKVIFDKLFISPTSKGYCIMIEARPDEKLSKLQKEVSEKFSKYGQNISEEYKGFEENFRPHITIARHLNLEKFKQAKEELKENIACEALASEIVLTITKEDDFAEWSNLDNKSYYKLGALYN